ncbi:MAG: hypothetical protein OEO79_05075 [Gemmatimonadota bacterium]|nr:hypothetical protein [Gemmatimonadota bacterium]MDH3422663.1 hypothetical protein [Gemmatimonadota bacterium]
MSDHILAQAPGPVPAPPPADNENEALIDAEKTFKVTLISAALFCLAAAVIILVTRTW